MENSGKNNRSKESGIALITALIIVAVSLMLIAGISYLLIGGFRVATLNKQFATVQEAAAGGAQHAAEVIRVINIEGSTSGMGVTNDTDATDVIFYCDTSKSSVLNAKTADGRYTITMTLKCLSQIPIPGGSAAMVFPPPPSYGTGGSMPGFYVLYSVTSNANDTANNTIGKVESVYRIAR